MRDVDCLEQGVLVGFQLRMAVSGFDDVLSALGREFDQAPVGIGRAAENAQTARPDGAVFMKL